MNPLNDGILWAHLVCYFGAIEGDSWLSEGEEIYKQRAIVRLEKLGRR